MRAVVRRLSSEPALTGTLALLRMLPAVNARATIALGAIVLLNATLPLAFMILSGLLVGSIPATVAAGVHSAAGRHTVLLLVLAACAVVLMRVLSPLGAALAANLGREVDRVLRERVMAAIARPRGIAHLEDAEVINLVGVAQGIGTSPSRPGEAVVALASLLPDWSFALLSSLVLARFHLWLGIGWVLAWPWILYVLQREYIRVGETAGGEASAVRRADYYRNLALTPGAAKELRVWSMTDWLTTRFQRTWRTAMAPVWAARRPGRSSLWITSGAVLAFSALAYGLLAWDAVHGSIGLSALVVYVTAVGSSTAFRAFDDQNMTLAYAAVSVPALLDLERRLRVPAETGDVRLPTGSPHHAIRFEDVSFKYAGQERDTLHGLDLVLPAGRSLAVVGANGAGKTTLVKLLCGLYTPSSGCVTVDGADLRRVDAERWRECLAAIFQDFTHYALSARENVTLAAGGSDGEEQAERAAGRAGAIDLIEALPHGWDTVLSRQFADGADLSGGQWQRIALARALFAVERGARVLVLDEPTANLDVRAEVEIYDRFLDLTAGLTTVLISHRFSTVRRADRIVVLEDGRIAESGTHGELMARGGTYARMFRLQAERFVAEPVESEA